MNDKLTGKTNNETLTKALDNNDFIGNLSILPRIKFCVDRQESSQQSLTAYSLARYSYLMNYTVYSKRLTSFKQISNTLKKYSYPHTINPKNTALNRQKPELQVLIS